MARERESMFNCSTALNLFPLMDKREQKKAAKKNGPMSVLPTNTSIMTFEVFSHTHTHTHTPKKSSNNLISGTSDK